MRQNKFPPLLLVIAALSIMGCVSTTGTPLKKAFQSHKERLADEYLEKARTHEAKGDPVEALRNYKIALTVGPENQEALHSRDRLEALLERKAKEHLAKGVELQGQGKYGEARRQFLTALRLRPDDPEVIEMLAAKKRVFLERYVVHEIKPGESLSKLALIYYGDYNLFSVIARYNNLSDASRIHAGEKIKVPQIEGVAFLTPEEGIETKVEETAPEVFSDWAALEDLLEQAGEGGQPEGETETGQQVAYYLEHGQELFHAGHYKEAALELAKVLGVSPDHEAAKEFTYRSHYQMAVALFEDKDYLAAKEQFMAALRFKSNCQESHAYIQLIDELYKEMHYKLGIQYYGEEKLTDAIREWELVRELDPNYKRVDYYINKAAGIQKKLRELRKE